MKIVFIIQDLEDNYYYDGDGNWVANVKEAKQYESYEQADKNIISEFCQIIKTKVNK